MKKTILTLSTLLSLHVAGCSNTSASYQPSRMDSSSSVLIHSKVAASVCSQELTPPKGGLYKIVAFDEEDNEVTLYYGISLDKSLCRLSSNKNDVSFYAFDYDCDNNIDILTHLDLTVKRQQEGKIQHFPFVVSNTTDYIPFLSRKMLSSALDEMPRMICESEAGSQRIKLKIKQFDSLYDSLWEIYK